MMFLSLLKAVMRFYYFPSEHCSMHLDAELNFTLVVISSEYCYLTLNTIQLENLTKN